VLASRLRLSAVVACTLATALATACNLPTASPSVAPTPTNQTTIVTSTPEGRGPALSGALKRGCQLPQSGSIGSIGLGEGETAVDFTLSDTHGNGVTLSGLLREKPVALVLGSFT
jgi:hypothetical protein